MPLGRTQPKAGKSPLELVGDRGESGGIQAGSRCLPVPQYLLQGHQVASAQGEPGGAGQSSLSEGAGFAVPAQGQLPGQPGGTERGACLSEPGAGNPLPVQFLEIAPQSGPFDTARIKDRGQVAARVVLLQCELIDLPSNVYTSGGSGQCPTAIPSAPSGRICPTVL